MKNSGASSSDPKGKRPMTQDDLEKVTQESNRIKRIKREAKRVGMSYEDYEVMVDEDAKLVEKQTTEDEKLAKTLFQFLKEEESILVNRQIKEDEKFAKALAQQEEDNLPKREKSIFAMSSEEEADDDEKEDLNVQFLRKRKRDVVGESNMSGSSSGSAPSS